jgi:hypothetical protein
MTNLKEPYAGFEINGEINLWLVSRLWQLSAKLPIFEYEVASFNGFDQDVWFANQQKPTINNILKHLKKIEKADFEYPIILSQNGTVLDGVHRICRAYLDGRKTIPAVQFVTDPSPDRLEKI